MQTGLTNNFIVEDVARTYRVRTLITHMIDYSRKDQSCYDLQQYIYEYLLEFDNVKLNQMYNDNKLRQFISQIILNQRNYKGSHYSKELKISNKNDFNIMYDNIAEVEYIEDKRIDAVVDYIELKSKMENNIVYTHQQLKSILAFTILKKYYMSDLTQNKLAYNLKVSRATVTNLLKIAKEDILYYWKKNSKYYENLL